MTQFYHSWRVEETRAENHLKGRKGSKSKSGITLQRIPNLQKLGEQHLSLLPSIQFIATLN